MPIKQILLRFSRVLALLVLCVGVAALNPNFLKTTNLMNVVRQASPQIITSLGMTMVMLTGGIDLSVGSVITLASVVAGYFLTQTNLPWVAAVLGAFAVASISGLLSGLLVAKVKLPAAIATYGMLWVARGAAFAIMGASPYYGFPDAFRYVGRGIALGVPVPIWIMIALVIVVYAFLKYTTLGRNMYAVGANQSAARASGIPVEKVLLWAYVLTGLFAGLAGVILCARLNAVDQDIGGPLLLPAIASPVMGGTSMAGGQGGAFDTVIGSLIMVVLSNAMNLLGISSLWQQFVIGLVVVLAVWFDQVIKRRSHSA